MQNIRPLMAALEAHRNHYDNFDSDYSVTEIIEPPQLVQLRKRYAKEIGEQTIDPDSEYHSFDGVAWHLLVELYLKKMPGWTVERRVWDKILDRRISGAPDFIYEPEFELWDLKRTSAWKKVYKEYEKWEQQLNLYHYLLFTQKRVIKKMFIWGNWKDWLQEKVFQYTEYPKTRMEAIPIRIWTREEQERFIKERLQMQIAAEDLEDFDLPHCTSKDMWEKETKWAVQKFQRTGKKYYKASRLLNSEADAAVWLKKNEEKLKPGERFEIQHRPGERTRCEQYCEVSEYCVQYHTFKNQQKENNK